MSRPIYTRQLEPKTPTQNPSVSRSIYTRQLEPKSPAQNPSVSRPPYTRQLEPKSPAQNPSVFPLWVGIARTQVIGVLSLCSCFPKVASLALQNLCYWMLYRVQTTLPRDPPKAISPVAISEWVRALKYDAFTQYRAFGNSSPAPTSACGTRGTRGS